jgi:hypothetical protein
LSYPVPPAAALSKFLFSYSPCCFSLGSRAAVFPPEQAEQVRAGRAVLRGQAARVAREQAVRAVQMRAGAGSKRRR